MYHEIGGKPVRRDPSLVRPVEAFKKDLELLYAAGFRPVNLSDVLEDNIDVPPGTSPVVLTFDDGRESQFRLIETATAYKVDPNSAMGILQAFSKQHPDWKMRATFFVLPKSNSTLEVFGQPGQGKDKLAYLLGEGMEIGNHSIHHRNMRRMTPAQIQAEIGGAHNLLMEAAPNARITAVALPMGVYPDRKNWPYLVKGTFQGKSYEYKAAMQAAWRPVPSPAAKVFDAMQLERISPADGTNGLRYWITKMTQSGEYPRYVSDGDAKVVSFPKGDEGRADIARLEGRQKLVYAYGDGGAGGGSKPIVSEADEGNTSPAPAGTAAPAVSAKPIVGG